MRPLGCKHYRGALGGESVCCAGVNMRELVGGPDAGWIIRLPCNAALRLSGGNQTVPCDLYEEPTAEELAEEEQAINASMARFMATVPLCSKIKAIHEGESAEGVDKCPVCGGELHWSHSGYNGHVAMRCETENCVRFME